MRFLSLFFVLLFAVAFAHDPQLSGVKVTVDAKGYTVQVTASSRRLAAVNPDPDQAVRSVLKLEVDGSLLQPSKGLVEFDKANGIVIWKSRQSGTPRTFQLKDRLFPQDSQSRTVYTIERPGEKVVDSLLDATHLSSAKDLAPQNPWGLAKQFVTQGLQHILSGADHVLFVMGLLLLNQSLRSILKVVTSFTVAHSITLSLAANHVFAPPSRIVEPLIALSIVAVAYENLRDKSKVADYRALVAFAFGLIHGFGFAGALENVGLTGSSLVVALASFNLGVELGQASIVLLCVPVIAWLASRQPSFWRVAVRASSYGISIVGALWFVQRILE